MMRSAIVMAGIRACVSEHEHLVLENRQHPFSYFLEQPEEQTRLRLCPYFATCKHPLFFHFRHPTRHYNQG